MIEIFNVCYNQSSKVRYFDNLSNKLKLRDKFFKLSKSNKVIWDVM